MAGNDNDLLKIQRPNGRDPEADKTAHDNEMAKLNEQEKALNKNIADMQQYLALKAQFQSNTTVGRIKSLQCSRDEPPPASAPPPARHEVKAWDGVVRGSPAEEYVKNARGGLDAVHGDTWHFQQSQNLQDAEIGATIDAALGKLLLLGGRLFGALRRAVKPRSPAPEPAPAPKPASPGNGTYVEKAAKPPPKVTATARIGDREFKGTNQQARENPNANQRTAAADQIEASKKFRAGDPNTNMENAHAEIEAMQKASDAGLTNGADMTIELSGQNMCTYCRSNVATMANEIGLNRLVVQGPQGETSIWVKGVGWIQKGW